MKPETIKRIDDILGKINDYACNVVFTCILLLVISVGFAIFYTDSVNGPNLNTHPYSFEYTSYNNDIEVNNIANNVSKNNGKIGYIMVTTDNYTYNYKLFFSEHKDSNYVYVYPTAKQAKLLKQVKDSRIPVLVEAKVVDTNDTDFYGIEIVDVANDDSTYNTLCTRKEIAIDITIALISIITLFFILVYIDNHRNRI